MSGTFFTAFDLDTVVLPTDGEHPPHGETGQGDGVFEHVDSALPVHGDLLIQRLQHWRHVEIVVPDEIISKRHHAFMNPRELTLAIVLYSEVFIS